MIKYPQYYHIGLPKTGTTSIQAVLIRDSRIHRIQKKYFNTFEYWEKEYATLMKENLINVVSQENLILQCGSYTKLSLTLDRIKRHSPDAHIIITIREQRKLMESRYKYHIPYYSGYYYGFEKWLNSNMGMDYLSLTMYGTLYRTICSFFPEDKVHFLMFEELKNNQNLFFEKFYKIIGIEPPPLIEDKKVVRNKSISESELSIIKKLNKYKLFRKGGRISKFEESLFRVVAKKFKNDKKLAEFRWAGTRVFQNIEDEMRLNNNELISLGVFEKADLEQNGYLL